MVADPVVRCGEEKDDAGHFGQRGLCGGAGVPDPFEASCDVWPAWELCELGVNENEAVIEVSYCPHSNSDSWDTTIPKIMESARELLVVEY